MSTILYISGVIAWLAFLFFGRAALRKLNKKTSLEDIEKYTAVLILFAAIVLAIIIN